MGKMIYLTFTVLVMPFIFSSCYKKGIREEMNQRFGDQHFKTAISLIELHKIRHGEYPQSLDSLEFIGEWDNIAFGSVEYEKLDTGYSLNLINGWIGKPEQLDYPNDFWKGLGLKKSNMKK